MIRRKAIVISDYTPADEPNTLQILEDDQGDYHLAIVERSEYERGIRIAASGTRYSHRVRDALRHLLDILQDENHPTVKELNK